MVGRGGLRAFSFGFGLRDKNINSHSQSGQIGDTQCAISEGQRVRETGVESGREKIYDREKERDRLTEQQANRLACRLVRKVSDLRMRHGERAGLLLVFPTRSPLRRCSLAAHTG